MLTQVQAVTDQLRGRLLQGEFQPGTHLQEVPIAAELGVSRTPVRAALAALEREGLLDYVAKRGFLVRRFSLAEIADKYLVRSILEGNAAAQCARLGLPANAIDDLKDCLAIGDRVLSTGKLDPALLSAYREMNNRFHSTIIEHSQSPATSNYVSQIAQIPYLSDRIILWHDYKLIDRSHEDHHRICDAIVRRDPVRAEALMREHVYYMGLVVQEHLKSDPDYNQD